MIETYNEIYALIKNYQTEENEKISCQFTCFSHNGQPTMKIYCQRRLNCPFSCSNVRPFPDERYYLIDIAKSALAISAMMFSACLTYKFVM